MSIKVLHLSVVRKLTTGQRLQLMHEKWSSDSLDNTTWEILCFQDGNSDEEFIRRLPIIFRNTVMRRLFAWLWLVRNAKYYDYVLCRYISFDIFAVLFAFCVKNRVTVHHSKEVYELQLTKNSIKGHIASKIEKYAGYFSIKNSVALLGVTEEIREYEVARHSNKNIQSSIYPNGLYLNSLDLLVDNRAANVLELAFVCGTFSKWHGLDLLLDEYEDINNLSKLDNIIILNLIGYIEPENLDRISSINSNLNRHDVSHKILAHGPLESEEYELCISKCHIALGSFGLFRKNLTEASTLKVREMLGYGIPVYSGHKDVALPDSFLFYQCGEVDLSRIEEFAKRNRYIDRKLVRDTAAPYIDKLCCMRHVISFLRNL